MVRAEEELLSRSKFCSFNFLERQVFGLSGQYGKLLGLFLVFRTRKFDANG